MKKDNNYNVYKTVKDNTKVKSLDKLMTEDIKNKLLRPHDSYIIGKHFFNNSSGVYQINTKIELTYKNEILEFTSIQSINPS